VSFIGVTGASFVLSALSTWIALKRPRGPLLLTIARWLLVVIVALYVVVFLCFYRPEGWLPLALEFIPSTTLDVLLGVVAGTLFVQLRRR
jgi:hypothetical protein